MGYIPTKTVRIANATTEMGSVLPIGATIYNVATKKTYKLTTNNLATDTLTTLIAANSAIELGGGGGSATHIFGEFTYASSITAPPPIGDVIFDNANLTLATKMYVSDLTATGTNVRGDLLSMRVGSNFNLEDKANAANYINFEVVSVTGQTGYVEYEVTHIHTGGTISVGHTFNLENIPTAGATTFTDLTDTPGSYSGLSDHSVKVNLIEDSLIFDDVAHARLTTWADLLLRQTAGDVHVGDSYILTDKGNKKISIFAADDTGMSWYQDVDSAGVVTEHKLDYIPPVADFGGTPTTGDNPVTVQFTDTSLNTPASWSWDFGDGNTSIEQNPLHTYTVHGHYTVTLIATNIKGSNTKVKTDYISVLDEEDKPPEIHIKLIPGETSFGFATGSPFTVEQDGTVNSYTPGSKTISGLNDASVITIVLTHNVALTSFKFKNDHILEVNLIHAGYMNSLEESFMNLTKMTVFKCEADLSGITNFLGAWSSSSLTSFPAIDTSGGVIFDSTWANSHKLINFPSLDLSSAENLAGAWAGCSVLSSFPATDFSNVTSINIAWRDCVKLKCFSGTLDFRNVTVTANFSFQYTPALTSPASTGTPVRSGIHALAGIWTNPNICGTPSADFESDTNWGAFPLTVTFTDTSTENPTSWAWDFGDGNTSTDQNPVHIFATEQDYTVALTATNAAGSNTNTKTDYITKPAIVTGHLIPGATDFDFLSDSPFVVTQSGTSTKYKGLTHTQTITGVNDASEIKITMSYPQPATMMKFKSDKWLSINLKEVSKMKTLESSFQRLGNLEHFSSDADLGKIENFSFAFEYCVKLETFPLINTSGAINLEYAWRYNIKFKNFPNIVTSKVTNFQGAWAECFILESFPEIDTTSGTSFRRTWDGCKILKCISGTLDFTNLTNGEWTFKRTPLLTTPAPHGTPVRNGDSGLAGIWTNPNPCP